MAIAEYKKAFYQDKESEIKSEDIDVSSEKYKKQIQSLSKGAEEKGYILMIVSEVDEDYDHKWVYCIGRTDAYENAKSYAMSELINLTESFILVEGKPFEQSVSLYRFLKYMSERVFNDTSFNVEDYLKGDALEDDIKSEEQLAEISPNDSEQIDIFYDPEREEESTNV